MTQIWRIKCTHEHDIHNILQCCQKHCKLLIKVNDPRLIQTYTKTEEKLQNSEDCDMVHCKVKPNDMEKIELYIRYACTDYSENGFFVPIPHTMTTEHFVVDTYR